MLFLLRMISFTSIARTSQKGDCLPNGMQSSIHVYHGAKADSTLSGLKTHPCASIRKLTGIAKK